MHSLLICIWMDWRRELNSWRTLASHTLKGDTHITCVSISIHSSQLGLIFTLYITQILIILACLSWSVQIFFHFGKICDPSLLTWNLLIASVLKEAQLNDNIAFITERIHLKKVHPKVLRKRNGLNLPARRQTKVDSLAVVWITPPPREPCKYSLDQFSSKTS